MHEISKNPTEWELQTWAWLAFIIAFGGVYNWILKARASKPGQASLVALLGELALCELVGIPVFMALHGGTDWAVGLSVAFAIAAGHYGTRLICRAEAFASAYACKQLGLEPEDVAFYEKAASSPSTDADNYTNCFDFGAAFVLMKQGVATRYMAWPDGQTLSIPVERKVPITVGDLWANPTHKADNPNQTVFILPAITLTKPDGTKVEGYIPTGPELLIPGWSRAPALAPAVILEEELP